MRIASAFLLGGNISCNQETRMGVVGVGRFAMGVRLIWYGCPPASMGVSTPTVEYNSPPMTVDLANFAPLVTFLCVACQVEVFFLRVVATRAPVYGTSGAICEKPQGALPPPAGRGLKHMTFSRAHSNNELTRSEVTSPVDQRRTHQGSPGLTIPPVD